MTVPVGVWQGKPIKALPAAPAYNSDIEEPEVTEFNLCCGICILSGFPYRFGGNAYKGFGSGYTRVGADDDIAAWLHKVHRVIRYVEYDYSYIMVSLNTQQMEVGVHSLLGEYFNFARLDDDFVNRSGSENVGIFGLLLNKPSEKTL